MPYVLKRRSLASHLGDVVAAPLAFLLVCRLMALLVLPIVALSLLIVWLCGGNIGPMNWDREFVVGMVGTVLLIALAAVPLALREWWMGSDIPQWSADGSREWEQAATQFVMAVLNEDPAAAARLAAGQYAREAFERARLPDELPPLAAVSRSELAARELNASELTRIDIQQRIKSKPRDGNRRAFVVVSIAGMPEWMVELVEDHASPRVEGFGPA